MKSVFGSIVFGFVVVSVLGVLLPLRLLFL